MTPATSLQTAAPGAHEARARLRRHSVIRSSTATGGTAPWWQGTLSQLEDREAEGRERLAEVRDELHRLRLENDRLSALLAVRDAALADSVRRESELRVAAHTRDLEALDARSAELAAAATAEELRAHISALVAERDAATGRAKTAARRADLAEAKLRTTTKTLKTRTARIARLEETVDAQERKIVWLRRRSERLTALQESRTYRFMKRFWRIRSLFRFS